VTASRVSYDLDDKLRAYHRNGVPEYLVWRVAAGAFDWFVLRHGDYVPMPLPIDGILRSEVFPGLWLDTAAALRDDAKVVRQMLERGLASDEHAAFVKQLAARWGR
jgi:hypothetical protein